MKKREAPRVLALSFLPHSAISQIPRYCSLISRLLAVACLCVTFIHNNIIIRLCLKHLSFFLTPPPPPLPMLWQALGGEEAEGLGGGGGRCGEKELCWLHLHIRHMVRAGDWVLEQMSNYIFNVGPAVHVYIGECACEGKRL